MTRHFALLVLALVGSIPSMAIAQEEDTGRHRIELTVGGGLSWITDAPESFDLAVGGQLGARAMVDLVHVRADASMTLPDPTRPELFQLRGDARLLFVTVHDFTWRRTDGGEFFRLLAGLGGEIDLPDDVGHLMLDVGFAMARLGSFDHVERPFVEAYGAYAGVTARVHFWEIRDELRVAVHGVVNPADIALSLDFGMDQVFAAMTAGFTASNRLYLQALRFDSLSLGPELNVQVEQIVGGVTVYATLGVTGTFGI